MEATGKCTIAIGAIKVSGKQANSIIDHINEGYVSHPVVVQPLVILHVRHVCVLLPLIMPHVRNAHLGLHIGVRLKG